MVCLVDLKSVSPLSQGGSAYSCAMRVKDCAAPAKDCALDMDAMVRFCRLLIGQGVADHLAEITGQSRSSAEKWLRLETRPSADALAQMIGHFGPAFIVACMPASSDWALRHARDEERQSLENQLETINGAARPVNGERQHG